MLDIIVEHYLESVHKVKNFLLLYVFYDFGTRIVLSSQQAGFAELQRTVDYLLPSSTNHKISSTHQKN